ncbi:heme oxygenase-like protein [Xenorhabdus cabanillasii]|uniref:Heme oxygenase-like protein n=1 Tax=Xenorhabdus cabanillasii TaxID=351673 RepID=A0A3D9UEQ1_9GAMM|nr:iron-containing redox enzyme family protein [Xenorhabdus cabanillasii]REF27978.1 heme oxygenase-like protein [Xenorhabdus cabanillasii]
MEKIVVGKSSMAYGYHNKKMINRCPLDELMKKDPQKFVFHLKNSSWFKGENANKMPFFSKLTSFEGPMYKVFTKNELLLIKKWAISERGKDNDLEDIIINSFPVMDILPHSHEYDDEKDIRKFFHQLMTCDDHYYLDWKCEKFVNDWLYKTRKKINKIPFKNYEETLLDEWFLERAKMQIEDYSQGRMVFNKSREDVISEALHLAPMVLLDGAWINHYSHHNLINDDIGKILFEIYADEIGNGYIEKNHPLIYRNLISEMGIELPDIASAAFSESEHFDDDDFQVPVFWLSISRFPKRFLPETLGLNLAMELSGVGGAYNQARDELKQYGFNTLFVDLHNSIDNAASGHSADALNAIKIYMNKHANKSNPKLTRLLWERVWTGYLSLSPPKKTLSFFLISNNYDI